MFGLLFIGVSTVNKYLSTMILTIETLTVDGKWMYSEGILSDVQFAKRKSRRVNPQKECWKLLVNGKWTKCPISGPSTPLQTIGCMIPKLDPTIPSKG